MYLIRFPDRDLYSNTQNSVFLGLKNYWQFVYKKKSKKEKGKAIPVTGHGGP
jgi:hypothetical protein